MVSLLLFGLSFMAFALTGPSLILFYIHWVVLAVVGAGTLSLTWSRVSGWFDRNRGLALGVASTGTGIAGFLVKPFTAWLITDSGWRTAYVAIGMMSIVLGLPIAYLFFRERRRAGAMPGISAAPEQPGIRRWAARSRLGWRRGWNSTCLPFWSRAISGSAIMPASMAASVPPSRLAGARDR